MERDENEISPKRRKLDSGCSSKGVLCNGDDFSGISSSSNLAMDTCEGTSLDYDSGYSAPTPSLGNVTSPCDTTCDTTLESQDDADDNASTVSNLSDLSALSDLSGQDWKPMSGSIQWIQRQMQSGIDPRRLLSKLGADHFPDYLDDVSLWKIIISTLAEPPKRLKLRHVNTLDDVVHLLKGAKNVIVLTGAGVSVSCGIPDFRSRDGIYARLAADFADLPDPQAMFDINYFTQDPRPFFKFARDIYPGKFEPSPCHRFIKLLERHDKLLRNYTQNIDTLEREASIERVIECHGSFATATCTKCATRVTADVIRQDILEQRIPVCALCQQARNNTNTTTTTTTITQSTVNSSSEEPNNVNNSYRNLVANGIMKPDIVFFGEGLPEHFHEAMTEDKAKCDLLLVIGSSLKVRPVALIPLSVPPDVPQVLINREPLTHYSFDVELLGDCDVIINQLCHQLGDTWAEGMSLTAEPLRETLTLEPLSPSLENISTALFDPSAAASSSYACEVSTCAESPLAALESCKYCSAKECECSASALENTTDESEYHMDLKHIKERHISVDSAKDSGIGDSSNSADMYHKYRKNFWQPKLVKQSVAERLPVDSYYMVPPCRYIFPGAEVYPSDNDDDDKFGLTCSDLSDTDCSADSADSSDSDDEAEEDDSAAGVAIGCNNDDAVD